VSEIRRLYRTKFKLTHYPLVGHVSV
jgi:hypothetical protein